MKNKLVLKLHNSVSRAVRAVLILVLVFTASCQQKPSPKNTALVTAGNLYTCSMHPQIRETKPGTCPICGMTLVKIKPDTTRIDNVSLSTLLEPANESVLASLPVTTAQLKNRLIPLTIYGRIEYDPRGAETIAANVEGRIEKLYVRYQYQMVTKGEKLLEIYSPELLTAEQNLLFLLKNDPGNDVMLSAAKEKLRLLGIQESELDEVIQTGKPLYRVGIYSNYEGHLHDAGMPAEPGANTWGNAGFQTAMLSLQEGMYVQKGQPLFMIMSHRKVWAALQIYNRDLSLVKTGTPVRIIPETDTTLAFTGKIGFIEPFYREGLQTLTARVYFDNRKMLPVGSQVSATMLSQSGSQLWLPNTAVLNLGLNKVVFLKKGNVFQVHPVTTGVRAGQEIVVSGGLTPKDSVAVNAAYLIDKESFIKIAAK